MVRVMEMDVRGGRRKGLGRMRSSGLRGGRGRSMVVRGMARLSGVGAGLSGDGEGRQVGLRAGALGEREKRVRERWREEDKRRL